MKYFCSLFVRFCLISACSAQNNKQNQDFENAIEIYSAFTLKIDSIDGIISQNQKEKSRLTATLNKINEKSNEIGVESKIDTIEKFIGQKQKEKISLENNKLKNTKENSKLSAIESKTKIDSIDALILKKQKVKEALYNKLNEIKAQNVSDSSLITKKLNSIDETIIQVQKGKAVFDKNLAKLQQELQQKAKLSEGSINMTFRGVDYLVYVSNLKKETINLHLNENTKKGKRNFQTIGRLKTFLVSKKQTPLMICNAGMFTHKSEPEGLYISDDPTCYFDLDTNQGDGNFYMKPNGVFFIDSTNHAKVVTTEEYAKSYNSKNAGIKLATQSGPMLVIDGKIHSGLTKGSTNRKIRSGVGVIGDKVVFATTVNDSNFFDFSSFYLDIVGVKDALFLDGAISLMYLHDLNPTELGGFFGPLISVVKK